KPFMEQLADQRRIAQRPRGTDGDAADRAVDTKQREFERTGAFAALLEVRLQGVRQALRQAFDIVEQGYRLGQLPLDRKRGNCPAWRYRLVEPAKRLVEPLQQSRAETADERRPRGRHESPHRAQADAFQAAAYGRLDTKCGKRQRRKES